MEVEVVESSFVAAEDCDPQSSSDAAVKKKKKKNRKKGKAAATDVPADDETDELEPEDELVCLTAKLAGA